MCIDALSAAAPSQVQVGRSSYTTTHTTAIGAQITALRPAYIQMNSSRSSVTPFAARFHNACSTAAANTSASASPPTPRTLPHGLPRDAARPPSEDGGLAR